MTTLEVVRWSETMDLPGFRQRIGGPALLVPQLHEDPPTTPPSSDDDGPGAPITSVTKQVMVDSSTDVTIDLDGHVLPVVRVPSNPYSDKIAIGRTRNCDVRIEHPSISRLHALLLRASDGGWAVVDAGSSNGTRLNGGSVEKNSPQRVAFGDIIAFGSVATQFVSPDTLYAALRNLRPLQR
jgi:pSer/pThr/pTyr-binding forkhead associated (FHA) protein